MHYATRTNDQIFKWANQKHLKSPNCKLCDKTENVTHLYIDCKRNKKIWEYFQKHQTLTQKQNTPLQHILTISSLSLQQKNKETNPNTNNYNTNPHMENKKQTTL